MNVQGAWQQGYTGKGSVVSILDDGIEKNHPDLMKNYVSVNIVWKVSYFKPAGHLGFIQIAASTIFSLKGFTCVEGLELSVQKDLQVVKHLSN